MAWFKKAFDWIVQLSEKDLPYRFSLSPEAQATDAPTTLDKTLSKQSSTQPQHDHALPKDPMDQVKYIAKLLHHPRNSDILIEERTAASGQLFHLIYSQIITDLIGIQRYLLEPLSKVSTWCDTAQDLATMIPCSGIMITEEPDELADGVVEGKVVVLLGASTALLCPFANYQSRNVGQAINETVVRGPQEGFTENISYNMSILRRTIGCRDLVFDSRTLQDVAETKVSIAFMAHLANPRLIKEIHRRLDHCDHAPIIISGIISQFIEDHPKSLFPTISYTERPDVVARCISSGQVAILVSNQNQVLIMPAPFIFQLSTAEDLYLRSTSANFLRAIRFIAFSIALLAPSIYVGLINFQQEMIPSDLLLAMKAARLNIPFPTLVEVLLLEVSFELIREASIRVPQVIGSTIGIVGALIIGQAAVEANLVSPIVVIIVSVTGLGSFAIPNQEIAFAVRILRFVFLLSSSLFGFLGIAVVFSMTVLHLASIYTVGVPYLTPLSPYRKNEEGFLRRSVLTYESFPLSFRTQKSQAGDSTSGSANS